MTKKPKAFIIRNKETGAQYTAQSGKRVWTTPGAAKNAYGNASYPYAARHRQPVDEYPHPRSGGKWGEVVRFNEQDVFEIIELTDTNSTNSLVTEAAISLLQRALGRLDDRALENEIIAFLEENRCDG